MSINGAKVLIIQRRLTHYRVPLFERLRLNLERVGVRLFLVHGQPSPDELSKKDSGSLAWANTVINRYFKVNGSYLCWQSIPAKMRDTDLVVITQENSILSNYPLLLKRRLGGPKVAFWGHGANLQAKFPNGSKERFKRWTTRQVDWWFAYTELSAKLVSHTGFPLDRVTNLENSVDTTSLSEDIASITASEVAALREKLGLKVGNTGIFVGSLYDHKRIDFLFKACDRLHSIDNKFQLLIVGDGPMRGVVNEYCMARPWAVWAGHQLGRNKALHLALADVLLNPGLVGLGIMDSFVAAVPMVTTDCGLHSPEISYLKPDENGLMTANTIEAYVSGVHRVLNSEKYRMHLAAGCRQAASHLTIENMANNFSAGLVKALSLGAC